MMFSEQFATTYFALLVGTGFTATASSKLVILTRSMRMFDPAGSIPSVLKGKVGTLRPRPDVLSKSYPMLS